MRLIQNYKWMRLEGNGRWMSFHKAIGLCLGHRVYIKPPSAEPPQEFLDAVQRMPLEQLAMLGRPSKPIAHKTAWQINSDEWPDHIE